MKSKQVISTIEFQDFIKSCRNYCELLELKDEIDSTEYLIQLQKPLLELYSKALNLKTIDLDSNTDFEEKLDDKEFELVENPKLIDKRSNIYPLGAIWYTMLTGQPPAGTELMENLKSIEGVDSSYIKSIEKCLANIESRTSSCSDLLNEIKILKKVDNN